MPRSHTAHESTDAGQLEALRWELLWTLSFVLLSLAEFNLSPSALINRNHERNSFQGILWVLLGKYSDLGAPTLTTGVRKEDSLVTCS